MSLAESGPHKAKTKVSKSSYQLSVASQSPGPSPAVLRKDGLHPGKSHERSHSDTPPVPVGKSLMSSTVGHIIMIVHCQG